MTINIFQFAAAEPVYVFTYVLTLLILIVHLVFVQTGRMMRSQLKTVTLICSIAVAVLATTEFIGVYLDNIDGRLQTLHTIVKFVEISITPVLPILMGLTINPHRKIAGVAIPCALSVALQAALLPFKLVFFVDGSGYHHASCYWIYPVLIALGATYLCIEFGIQAKLMQSTHLSYIIMTVLLPVVCLITHIVVPEIRFSWLSVSVALVFMYCSHCNIVYSTDQLTELLDRSSFDHDLSHMKTGDVLVFFDINKFKQLNDEHGHAAGDKYLSVIAGFLRQAYDKVGRCYRIGGDEFAVIINKRNADVKQVNEAFVNILDRARQTDPLLPWISVGYSAYTGTESVIDVFNTADKRMYSNKSGGSKGVD